MGSRLDVDRSRPLQRSLGAFAGFVCVVFAASCAEREPLVDARRASTATTETPAPMPANPAAAEIGHGDEFSAAIARPVPGDAAASAAALARSRQERSLGRHERARRALDEALRLDPANVEALRELGATALDRALGFDPVQSILAFRTLRLLLPDDAAAQLGELTAATAIGDGEAARPLAAALGARQRSGALKLDADSAANLAAAEATLALLDGDTTAALAAATRAVEARPTWRHLEVLARVQEEAGRPQEALAALNRALGQRPDDATLHFTATRLQRRLGHAEAAARHQRAYLALFPFENDSSDAFRDDHRRRIELRREFLATAPGLPLARFLLTRELIEGGELDEAAKLLEQQVQAPRDDPQAWYLLATVRARQHDAAGARAAAERLRGKVPDAVQGELLQEIEEALRGSR